MVEYECRSCGDRVERSPYCSTCPACGGKLRRVAERSPTG